VVHRKVVEQLPAGSFGEMKEFTMPAVSSLQLPPPKHWQDFETLCHDLWRAIWNDPNAQKNGRQGQPQCGVDIYGRPNQGVAWAGIQCKGRNNLSCQTVTQDELLAEVEKAKSFKPLLSDYTIATTAPRDAAIQEVAREITERHRKCRLFNVHAWSWDDIGEELGRFPQVVTAHYPQLITQHASSLEFILGERISQETLGMLIFGQWAVNYIWNGAPGSEIATATREGTFCINEVPSFRLIDPFYEARTRSLQFTKIRVLNGKDADNEWDTERLILSNDYRKMTGTSRRFGHEITYMRINQEGSSGPSGPDGPE
jgi:hypothetical protein